MEISLANMKTGKKYNNVISNIRLISDAENNKKMLILKKINYLNK